MNLKNYFSIVINNNYKGKEENIVNSNSKNNPKTLFAIPIFKIDKILIKNGA